MKSLVKTSAFGLRASLLLLALVCPLARGELVTTRLPKVGGLSKAELCHESTLPAIHGVLVLCPGMNGDGRILVAEAPWVDFARAQGLGLAGVSFSSPPDLLYGHPAKGYYYAEQGSGEALIKGLRRLYGGDVKLLFYGFSGGAQFGSRFAEQNPGRMLGWAAYSASFWSEPLSASPASVPGIVACGEFDAERYGPSFAYFQQGRRKEARWTWVSLGRVGHLRHRGFEEFIRSYFAAVLAGDFKEAVWLDAETKQATTEDDRLLNPALSVWLPTPAIAALWLKLHHP